MGAAWNFDPFTHGLGSRAGDWLFLGAASGARSWRPLFLLAGLSCGLPAVAEAQESTVSVSLPDLELESTLAPSVATETEDMPAILSETAPGKLVICGGGVLPTELLTRFLELAGGALARVVVVTTASEFADSDAMEEKLTFWREQVLADLCVLHTRRRAMADEPEFWRPLASATGVWFVGGDQNWLTETYLGTRTRDEIHGVLARGGVVGGTSAGAAVMSPVMIKGGDLEAEVGPGFGLLPGAVVDQHFLKRNRQPRLQGVLASRPGLLGLGIDEGTALIVEGNQLTVLGESEVVACWAAVADRPAGELRLSHGAQADLRALLSLVDPGEAESHTAEIQAGR